MVSQQVKAISFSCPIRGSFPLSFATRLFDGPVDSAKHTQRQDAVDCPEMDRCHSPVGSKRKGVDSHRRARLHWNTLQRVASNSMWAQLDQDDLENIEINEDEFQSLFQVVRGAVTTPVAPATRLIRRAQDVRVIGSKRANNGGIILARLKMSYDDFADAVDRIGDLEITAEQIEKLVEYLPTKEERKALESYMSEGGQYTAEKYEGLCECEKFMVSMMTVKQVKRKVRALMFKLQFEGRVALIHHDLLAIEDACEELINSVRLRQLFGIVLKFGNRLNMAGNCNRKAGAFSLDSLLKLHQTKAFDKKTTFLVYLVKIVQQNSELLLRFKDEIPTVFKSEKVYWDQCLNDLGEVERELENVRRISLYQARNGHIYRLHSLENEDDNCDENSLGGAERSLYTEEKVEALKSTPIGLFAIAATKSLSELRGKADKTKLVHSRLLEYFGEEDKSRQPHEIFDIIAQFSRDFDKAKEFVFEKEKLKLREEHKKNWSSCKPPAHPPIR
jgi:Formin Homology 2 Domain